MAKGRMAQPPNDSLDPLHRRKLTIAPDVSRGIGLNIGNCPFTPIAKREDILDQDNASAPTSDVTTLGRKAWTAYIGPAFIALLLLGMVVPMAWHASWIAGVLALAASLAFVVYRVLTLMSVHLYWDDNGIWLYSGFLPWNKGVSGVKWRDLDEANYFQTMWSWMFKSYSIRVGHRFTKSSEMLLTHITKGHEAVMAINERHRELVRNNLLT